MFRKPRPAENDFTEDMLPHTRREVFFDVLKLHWTKLLLLGLISLVFALPLFVTATLEDLYVLSAYSELSGKELAIQIRHIQNLFSLLDVAFYMFYFAGFSALARIIKLYAFEEPVHIATDFAKGIRQNIKQYLLLGLIAGLMIFACKFFSSAAFTAEGGGIVWNFGDIPTVIFALLFAPVGAYMTVTQCVYSLSFRMHIKYGCILYGKNIFKTLLAVICCFAVFLLQGFPLINGNVFYVHIVGGILCPVLVPFIMLAFWLFTYNRLDDAINRDYYPELVNKGIVSASEKSSRRLVT